MALSIAEPRSLPAIRRWGFAAWNKIAPPAALQFTPRLRSAKRLRRLSEVLALDHHDQLRIRAHFVVSVLSPAHKAEIASFDLCGSSLAPQDGPKDPGTHRDQSAKQPHRLRAPRHRQLHLELFQ